jgi:YD repeat-containing protein
LLRLSLLSGSYDDPREKKRCFASQTPGASVSFDASNHKLDGSTVYDAAGNIMKDASHQYTYDAEGNLLSVDNGATASYVYDALNQRVQVKSARRRGWRALEPQCNDGGYSAKVRLLGPPK